jgi:putative membrane protein
MIWREKKRLWALILFTLSGVLGLIVLNTPNMNQPLFPLLSGLFAVSLLLLSLLQDSSIPKQKHSDLKLTKKTIFKASSAATGVGFIAAFLPGFGSSQAAIIAQQIVGDLGDEGFLSLVGGINTANMLISIATAFMLNKARNGAILVVNKLIGEINQSTVIIFLASALIAGALAVILGINISKTFCRIIVKVNYKFLILSIISFITVLTFVFDGLLGLLILMTATGIGITTSEIGIGKNHLMGCLIIPVILFFIL